MNRGSHQKYVKGNTNTWQQLPLLPWAPWSFQMCPKCLPGPLVHMPLNTDHRRGTREGSSKAGWGRGVLLCSCNSALRFCPVTLTTGPARGGAAARGRCGPGAAPPFPHGGQPGPGGLQRGAEGSRRSDPVKNYPLSN